MEAQASLNSDAGGGSAICRINYANKLDFPTRNLSRTHYCCFANWRKLYVHHQKKRTGDLRKQDSGAPKTIRDIGEIGPSNKST